jgi:hypothetical protein
LLRGIDHIAEHGRAAPAGGCPVKLLGQAVSVEDIVAQDQRDAIRADEFPSDDEGIGEAARAILGGIGEGEAKLRAVAQEPPEQRQILRRRNNEDIANAGEHQHRQRVIDHRLVEDGQQLLRDDHRHGVKTRRAAASKDDPLHCPCPVLCLAGFS